MVETRPPPTRRAGGGRARPAAAAVVLAAALAAVLAFYSWTAFTNARGFPTQMDFEGRDYFNLLTDAFLNGRASLLVEPAPELLALEDPYDPTTNYLANRVHDLSLYEGKYYLYWGPTPVLTLFAPARLVLPGDLPERAAVVVYAFAGLLFSLVLLRWLVRRYLPATPSWMLCLGGVALATGNVMPFLLRRPTVYEVAISAGFCFAVASVYFVLTGALRERPSLVRLATASLFLGLAVGARLTMALVGLVHVGVLVGLWLRRRWDGRPDRLGATAALLGPAVVCGVLLLVYNQVRFDSLTEFGLRYQLNDVKPYPEGLAHVPRGLYYYLVAPPRFDLNFPFFHLPPPPAFPGATPRGYNLERVGGLLAVSPLVLMASGLPFAMRGRAGRDRELRLVLVGLLAVGGVTLLALVVMVNGVTMRYAPDFATWFMVVGVVTWMASTSRAARVLTRRALVAAGALLILWGAVVGVAVSFTGTTDGLRVGNPALFDSLEQGASGFPTALTMMAGRPAIVDVSSPEGVSARLTYGTVTRRGATLRVGRAPATVEIVSPHDRDAVLRAVVSGPPQAGGAGLLLAARSSSGPTAQPVPPSSAVTDVPVRLVRGRNVVELWVEGAGASPAGSHPEDSAVVELADLRLSSSAVASTDAPPYRTS